MPSESERRPINPQIENVSREKLPPRPSTLRKQNLKIQAV
jgi:hypothetical protein